MAWQPKCGPAPFCHAHSHISEEPLLYLMFICPLLYRHGGLRKNIMWHIMPWICAYITLCLYIWIYIIWAISLAITIIFVWEIDRACISIICVRHPRQRAGIAMACPLCTPAASLAHRATASCTPIVHSQLPVWPVGQPPAARPLCIRPAASLAHRATASCTPIVHPPSCQPGPSGNRQLHAQLTPIGHPPSCQPGPSGNRQLHARLTLSCTVNSRAAPGPPFSAHASTPSPVPSNLWLISPLFPHITDEDETRMPVFKGLPN